jgi:hypothetical protein
MSGPAAGLPDPSRRGCRREERGRRSRARRKARTGSVADRTSVHCASDRWACTRRIAGSGSRNRRWTSRDQITCRARGGAETRPSGRRGNCVQRLSLGGCGLVPAALPDEERRPVYVPTDMCVVAREAAPAIHVEQRRTGTTHVHQRSGDRHRSPHGVRLCQERCSIVAHLFPEAAEINHRTLEAHATRPVWDAGSGAPRPRRVPRKRLCGAIRRRKKPCPRLPTTRVRRSLTRSWARDVFECRHRCYARVVMDHAAWPECIRRDGAE